MQQQQSHVFPPLSLKGSTQSYTVRWTHMESAMKFIQLLALASALSLGCNGETDDDSTDDTDTDTDTDIPETLITIAGTAIDIASQSPAAEGLCAAIIDPTAAVTGGDAETIGGTVIGANGAFSVDDIPITAPFGLFTAISDCEGTTEPTVWTSMTGILNPSYSGLNDGDTLDVTAASVSVEMLTGIEASLVDVGATETAAIAGAMIAWVRDSAGNPIAGATVACEGCGTFYYFDQDIDGGLFASTTTGVNAATDASGMLLLLSAPTSTYTPTADGYTFSGLLFGGAEGVATFVEFVASE
jgi:hypothetical protein